MFSKRLLLFTLLAMLSLQCQKQGVLPEATQTGNNTFGCTVNGIVFTPNTIPASGFERLGINYGPSGTNIYYLSIRAGSKTTNENIEIIYTGRDLKTGDKITLADKTTNSTVAYASYTKPKDTYQTVASLNGELIISKIDPLYKIISGMFSFEAINQNGDRVSVKDGIFDLTYQ